MEGEPEPFWDVIGVGANSVDRVYRLPGQPATQGANAKMRICGHSLLCGGQTATTLSTCAAMGLRCKYIGAFGESSDGQLIHSELAARGVDLAHTVFRNTSNQFAVILIEQQSGERIVLWDRNEELALYPAEVPEGILRTTRHIHVDDVDMEAALRVAAIARAAGISVTSDIDRITKGTEELIQTVSISILAEHVTLELTGEAEPESALRKLRGLSSGMLCVTLGAHGSMLLAGSRTYYEPAFQIQAVDTTGAGDVFRGAFIHALLRGDGPQEILQFANAAAALSCTRIGAMNGVPGLKETNRLLALGSQVSERAHSGEQGGRN
jgi:sulfofructose kinase